jgi:hypothetical protein
MWLFPQPSSPAPSYSIPDLCKLANSGDLILIGNISTNANLIKFVCATQWSHIGIIVEDIKEPHNPFLFEAVLHAGKTPEVINGQLRPGVRVLRLSQALEEYDKKVHVAIRPWQATTPEIYQDYKTKFQQVLMQCIHEWDGLPYEKRWLEFLKSRFWGLGDMKDTYDSIFCSELVGAVYLRMNLLDKSVYHANQFLPDDFCTMGGLEITHPDISWGKEFFIQL